MFGWGKKSALEAPELEGTNGIKDGSKMLPDAIRDINQQAANVLGQSTVGGKPHTEYFDQSTLDAFSGHNFHPVENTSKDRDQWMAALDEMSQNDPNWLVDYNNQLRYSGAEMITMEELRRNQTMRRLMAQTYLHDKAEKEKAIVGPRPVPYNQAPFNTPLPSYLAKPQVVQAQPQPTPKEEKKGGWLNRAKAAVTGVAKRWFS